MEPALTCLDEQEERQMMARRASGRNVRKVEKAPNHLVYRLKRLVSRRGGCHLVRRGRDGFLRCGHGRVFREGESGGEALAGEFGFAETEMGEAAEVETVGLAPGVLAIGFDGEIEGFAGGLESFLKVAGREVGFGEGGADIDRVFAEAAGVGEEDAGFAFGDGLGKIAEMAMNFAGGLEAAELEIDGTGFLGEFARLFQMFCRRRRLIGRKQASE